jgi:hypothetical protein
MTYEEGQRKRVPMVEGSMWIDRDEAVGDRDSLTHTAGKVSSHHQYNTYFRSNEETYPINITRYEGYAEVLLRFSIS